jgi:hypothetical protein
MNRLRRVRPLRRSGEKRDIEKSEVTDDSFGEGLTDSGWQMIEMNKHLRASSG